MLILVLKVFTPASDDKHPVTDTHFMGAFDSKEDVVKFLNEVMEAPATDFQPASNSNRHLLSMYGKSVRVAEETSTFPAVDQAAEETYLLAQY